MARLNVSNGTQTLFTHEGARAKHINPLQQLRRLTLSCLLWEREFYVDGKTIVAQIEEAAVKVRPEQLASLAIEARKVMHLRHVPLLLTSILASTGPQLVAETIERVVSRADELGELLAVHWRNGRQPVSRQMRRGLQRAFRKFDEYGFAKYDRDGKIKLRDVLRLVRPKPDSDVQSALFGRIKRRELATPDTWEVSLSGGADKRATFERLLKEEKLGYLALIRNLRNMAEAGVDGDLVRDAILARKGAHNVLPFRYIAAMRAAPQYALWLDKALFAAIGELPPFNGKTIVLIDVSGSMDWKLSAKSDLTRIDAGAALASVLPGDNVRVFTFSHAVVEVPPHRGLAGIEAIVRSQPHGGTYLGAAVKHVSKYPHDRLIVITDEQSHDAVGDPTAKHAYMINVGSNKNGVGYGRWTHLDGFSEGVIRFIREIELETETVTA